MVAGPRDRMARSTSGRAYNDPIGVCRGRCLTPAFCGRVEVSCGRFVRLAESRRYIMVYPDPSRVASLKYNGGPFSARLISAFGIYTLEGVEAW